MNIREKIIDSALGWEGTLYHHQGRLKKSKGCKGGVDCMGLIMGVANEVGLQSRLRGNIHEFDYTNYIFCPPAKVLFDFLDTHLVKIDSCDIDSGDILLLKFYGQAQHVAIYMARGAKQIIHATNITGCVVVEEMANYWEKRVISVYRFVNCITER